MTGFIPETNIPVFYTITDCRQLLRFRIAPDQRYPSQISEDAFHRHQRHLHVIVIVADRLNRIVEHDQRRNKRNEVSGADLLVNDQITPGPNHRGNTQRHNKMHQRRHHSRPLNHFDPKLKHRPQRFAKTGALILVKIVRSNNPVAVISLVIMAHHRRAGKNSFVHHRLNPASHRRQRIQSAKQHHHRNQRQLPRIVKKHKNQRYRRKNPGCKQFQIRKQPVACYVNVGIVADHHLTRGRRIKKSGFVGHQTVKQVHFNIVGNFAPDPRIQISCGIIEQTLQTTEYNDQNRNIIGGVGVFLHHNHIHIRLQRPGNNRIHRSDRDRYQNRKQCPPPIRFDIRENFSIILNNVQGVYFFF